MRDLPIDMLDQKASIIAALQARDNEAAKQGLHAAFEVRRAMFNESPRTGAAGAEKGGRGRGMARGRGTASTAQKGGRGRGMARGRGTATASTEAQAADVMGRATAAMPAVAVAVPAVEIAVPAVELAPVHASGGLQLDTLAQNGQQPHSLPAANGQRGRVSTRAVAACRHMNVREGVCVQCHQQVAR